MRTSTFVLTRAHKLQLSADMIALSITTGKPAQADGLAALAWAAERGWQAARNYGKLNCSKDNSTAPPGSEIQLILTAAQRNRT
jgi:hypothetical protein